MPNISRKVFIKAPVERVFEYVDEPLNCPEWVPGVVAIRDVIGQGVGKFFRWTYKMAGVRFNGESTCTDFVPNQRIVIHSRGGVISVWTYSFKALSKGTEL